MKDSDEFSVAINRLCRGVSERVAELEEVEDRQVVDLLGGTILNCIREAMANLLMCELECERLLHRGP